MSEGFVISGKEQMAAFQMARVYTALRLQERTGLKVRGGSLIKYAKQMYGVKGRTAKAVADDMKAKYGLR